jgi:hypothetical protein
LDGRGGKLVASVEREASRQRESKNRLGHLGKLVGVVGKMSIRFGVGKSSMREGIAET